jgi:endo-1,4-beta-xylanase
LAREYNLIIPEGEMMWENIHPLKDHFNFAKADFIVNFANKNGMDVHGHALVAHNQQPPWLKAEKFSSQEMSQIVKDHIFTVMKHFRGRVQAWNVTNEALVCNTDIRPQVQEPPCRPDNVCSALLFDKNFVRKHADEEILHALKYTRKSP